MGDYMFKRKFLSKSIAVSLMLSLSANPVLASGWPTVDLSAIAAIIKQTEQEIDQFQKSIQQWQNQLTAGIQGTSQQVDAMNNGFANSIVRQNQKSDQLYNKALEMNMQPSQDACATYSVSNALNDATCSFISSVADSSNTRANNFLNQGVDLTPTGSSQKNAENILDQAKEISHDESGNKLQGVQNDTASPLVVRADIMLGSKGDTYDALTQKSTKLFNDIVIGANVATPPPNENQGDSLNYVDNYLRPTAIRAISANSLDTIRALRVGQDNNPDKPSIMQLLQKFVDDHYGTPDGDEWLKKVTNTQENAEDYMSDSAILRSVAQMQAFSNYLNMLKYQSQLRQETIESALLALKNKEVYNS